MDAGKFGRSKGKEPRGEQSQDAVYSVVSHMERTLFVVDLSKLEAESDTLAEAMVVYRPKQEFRKSQYEQRCSQLIGLSLCAKNLTGKYPKFLLLRGTGFAIHSLGNTYIMGLSSRPDEPGSCAVACLESVCNYFRFYYHSPDTVMQSCQGVWETFTTAMSGIFNYIIDYITIDQHSVPAMLKPLPYLNPIRKSKQASMLCMRVLRTCQKHHPIIGGCVMHNSKLAVSQFPPSLTEMLILVGSKGVDLEQRSVLEDNIAPEKVWVLEVFLTKEESNEAKDQRKDLTAFQATYASLDISTQLSTLHWRFQTSIHSSKSSTESIKSRRNWRRKSCRGDAHKERRRAGNIKPVASSTPHPKASSSSLKSEDAVVVSPGMSKVSFINHGRTPANRKPFHPGQASRGSPSHSKCNSAATSPNTGNETDELYLDAVDDVDPTAAIGPEMLRLFSRSTSQPNGEGGGGSRLSSEAFTITEEGSESAQVPVGKVKEVEAHAHGTGSTSSEGFATPSPTPPRTSVVSQMLQIEDSAAHDITGSFQTAYDQSLQVTSEEGGEGKGGTNRGSPHHLVAGQDATNHAGKHGKTATTLSPLHKATSHPTPHNGFLGNEVNSNSDDDFVDSEDIDEILKRVAKEKSAGGQSRTPSSPPPPLIPRRGVSTATQNSTTATLETPPTPPVRGNSAGRQFVIQEEEEPDEKPPPIPPRLHTPESNSVVAGILDNPIGYPFLPMNVNTQPTSTAAKLISTPSEKVGANGKVPWIYGTLERSNTHDVPGSSVGGGAEGRGGTRAVLNSDSHEATPMPTGDEGVAVGGAMDKSTDAATGQDRDVGEGQKLGASKDRYVDRDYEEIDDDVEKIKAEMDRLKSSNPTVTRPQLHKSHEDSSRRSSDIQEVPPKPTNPEPVKDVGNAALYLEHDEEIHDTDESKNSSMTVTLDLSHIAKDDIMYSSREKKVGSSSVDISRITMSNGYSSAEETGGDGTVTPIEMTYNDSMFGFMKAKFEQQDTGTGGRAALENHESVGETNDGSSGLNDSGEYSSMPDEDENVFNSADEIEESIPDQPALGKAREKSKTWLSRTMDRRKVDSAEVEKYTVYVQQYMNTFVILLADSGLQHQHHILNELWRLLADQLISLDMTFERTQQMSPPTSSRTAACMVTYSGYEKMCEAHPITAAYHFRHAVRRAHQEYLSDPTLRQISLSKEHCRMLCQRVHEREIFFQPSKLGGDALSLHGVLERQAKVKCSLRQQPIGGPKIMFI